MQRIAAVVVACFLFAFVAVIGIAMVSYPKLLAASQKVDAHWKALHGLHAERAKLAKAFADEASQPDAAEKTRTALEEFSAIKMDANQAPVFVRRTEQYRTAQQRLRESLSPATAPGNAPSPEMSALAQNEAELRVATDAYESAAKDYNLVIRRFPVSLITRALGFLPKQSMEAKAAQ